MHKFFAAAACAIFLVGLSMTGASAEKTYPKGTTPPRNPPIAADSIMVGIGPENHRLIVTLGLPKTGGTNPLRVSYAYNPANANVNPQPTPMYDVKPLPGIVVAISKICCPPWKEGAQRTIDLNNGVGTLGDLDGDGTYNLAVTVPGDAIAGSHAAAPQGQQTARSKSSQLLFTLNASHGQVVVTAAYRNCGTIEHPYKCKPPQSNE